MSSPQLFFFRAYDLGDRTVNTYHTCSADRVRAVKACTDPALLRDALGHTDLQGAVRKAIERRLRELEATA